MKTAQPIFKTISQHGEGPIWNPKTQCLYWVDIMENRFFIGDPSTGAVVSHQVGDHLGALALTTTDQIVLALRRGFAVYDLGMRQVRAIDPAVLSVDDVRFNDGAVDPAGRFFAGTMPYDCERPLGKLYRLDPDLTWSLCSEPYTVCNGIAWNQDRRTMFFVDSFQKTVFAFEYDVNTGALGKRSVHLKFDDLIPDGLTIDTEDGLWIAFWGSGEVRRYDQSGRLTTRIVVPAMHTTSCCFGGADLDVLYITTSRVEMSESELAHQPLAGRIFTINVNHKGFPENLFDLEGNT